MSVVEASEVASGGDWAMIQSALTRGQWLRAVQASESLLARDAHHVQAWVGLGMARLELKQHRLASGCLQRAWDLAPDDPYVLANMATTLRTLGQLNSADQVAERAAEILVDEPLVQLNRHLIQQERGDLDGALRGYEAIVKRWPTLGVAHYHLGHVNLVQGKWGSAERCLRRSLALDPLNQEADHALFAVRLRLSQSRQALEQAQGWLRVQPHNPYSLALHCIALRQEGHEHGAAVLDDARNWVKAFHLGRPPAGWSSTKSFNEGILRHVQNHPDLGDHRGQATVHGLRVEHILAEPAGPVEALARWILHNMSSYLDHMRRLPHPYASLIDKDFALRGWAVLMQTGGHETPHLHPGGALSCVYYPALPEVVRNEESDAGNLCFGVPDPIYRLDSGPPPFNVSPREGMLLIFPSWLWHHTVPFYSEQQRLSIAFDLYATP